jgi:hypothetical protein
MGRESWGRQMRLRKSVEMGPGRTCSWETKQKETEEQQRERVQDKERERESEREKLSS